MSDEQYPLNLIIFLINYYEYSLYLINNANYLFHIKIVCSVCFRLYVPVKKFSVLLGWLPGFNQY